MSITVLDFHRELDRQLSGNDLRVRTGQNKTMKMELKESPQTYELLVEAPGVNKEEIRISFENGIMKISADYKETKTPNDERVHFSERTYGHVSRQIRLPRNIDSTNITAKYDTGVVKIEIPKKQSDANLIRIE